MYFTIEVYSADEFLERRRLQNDPAVAVSDYAGSVEDDAVVSTDQVNEYDRNAGGFSAMRNHGAALGHLALVEWRRVDRNENVGAEVNQFIGRIVCVESFFPKRFVVPKVFADSDTEFRS